MTINFRSNYRNQIHFHGSSPHISDWKLIFSLSHHRHNTPNVSVSVLFYSSTHPMFSSFGIFDVFRAWDLIVFFVSFHFLSVELKSNLRFSPFFKFSRIVKNIFWRSTTSTIFSIYSEAKQYFCFDLFLWNFRWSRNPKLKHSKNTFDFIKSHFSGLWMATMVDIRIRKTQLLLMPFVTLSPKIQTQSLVLMWLCYSEMLLFAASWISIVRIYRITLRQQ